MNFAAESISFRTTEVERERFITDWGRMKGVWKKHSFLWEKNYEPLHLLKTLNILVFLWQVSIDCLFKSLNLIYLQSPKAWSCWSLDLRNGAFGAVRKDNSGQHGEALMNFWWRRSKVILNIRLYDEDTKRLTNDTGKWSRILRWRSPLCFAASERANGKCKQKLNTVLLVKAIYRWVLKFKCSFFAW